MNRRRTKEWWAAYREYLASPEWDAVRKQAMDRDGRVCQDCGARATEEHHENYDNVGNESPDDLRSLCSKCHRKRHPERQRRAELEEEVMP